MSYNAYNQKYKNLPYGHPKNIAARKAAASRRLTWLMRKRRGSWGKNPRTGRLGYKFNF